MARVLLSGYYGFGNLGDEALLEVIVERMRRRFRRPSSKCSQRRRRRRRRAITSASTARWDWRAMRAAIARADVVLSGGGGLLQNATSLRSLLYYAGILREAIRARRKTMVFAQSIGPLDFWGRMLVASLLPRPRSCDGSRRALAHAHARARAADAPGAHCRSGLYDAADERINLSGEGLGPESGAYAVISVRKAAAGLRDAPADRSPVPSTV